jgi:hypothetical protein
LFRVEAVLVHVADVHQYGRRVHESPSFIAWNMGEGSTLLADATSPSCVEYEGLHESHCGISLGSDVFLVSLVHDPELPTEKAAGSLKRQASSLNLQGESLRIIPFHVAPLPGAARPLAYR